MYDTKTVKQKQNVVVVVVVVVELVTAAERGPKLVIRCTNWGRPQFEIIILVDSSYDE